MIASITALILSAGSLLFSAEGQLLGGSPSAPVQIEVFSDFQCAACREFYLETIKKILPAYCSANKASVIYHETPLKIHQYSRKAAKYSEAASRMGLHNLLRVFDALFINQLKWGSDGKIEVFLDKALSPKDFQLIKTLVNDPSIEQAIQSQEALGNKMQIQSTPTLIITYRGKQERVTGMVAYSTLKSYLDSKLK
jgi:protein-disulfide isomerase